MTSLAGSRALMYDAANELGLIRFIRGISENGLVAAYLIGWGKKNFCDHELFSWIDSQVPRRGGIHERLRYQRRQAGFFLVSKLVEASKLGLDFSDLDHGCSRPGLEIVYDHLGAPNLFVDGTKGPGISFSHSSDTTWAALCGNHRRCGIDAAQSDDFSDDYPFHRVFCRNEIDDFLSVTKGNVSEAAALIWSAKEAAVKALGCAFHLVDPLDARVERGGRCSGTLQSSVLVNFGRGEERSEGYVLRIPVVTVLVGENWVSVAITKKNRFA